MEESCGAPYLCYNVFVISRTLLVNLFLATLGVFSFVGFGWIYKNSPEKVSQLFSLPPPPTPPHKESWRALLPELLPKFQSPFKESKKEEAPPAGEVAPRSEPTAPLPKEMKTEIKISEEDINQYLAKIPAESLPLMDPKIAFSGGKVVVTGRLAKPVEGSLRAEVRVFLLSEKQVGVKVDKAAVNNFPLPVFLLPQLETPFNDFIAAQLGEFVDYQLKALTVESGFLILRGVFTLK